MKPAAAIESFKRRACDAWRASWLGRKAQTTIEYMLVTMCLTIVFFVIYRVVQALLTRQFRMGGIIILKMYTQPYN